jgi:hypothetical protein
MPRILGSDLKVGDVIDCWGGGPWQITSLEPYRGPHDFICAVAKGQATTIARIGISIESHLIYDVLTRATDARPPSA